MEKLVISGQKKLVGEVTVNGAKNAAVAIIPAALLAKGTCIIENLPYINDTICIRNSLIKMGVDCEFTDRHTLKVDTTNIRSFVADYESIRKIRASYYLLGALLGRFKEAEVAMPGGCNFGSRPIDLHLKGFKALGATVIQEHGMIKVKAEKLVGTDIYLDVESVGATINIMLAAVFAEGQTIIENAAKEPHVVDTANFLNKMGANIKGAGTETIKITGVEELHGITYSIIPDQIEAGTYMIASAITNGNVLVKGVIPKHMESITAKLKQIGCIIEEYDDEIRVLGSDNLKSINLKTATYPGFPTDLQPQMATLLCICNGVSKVTETVWENRYQYLNELIRLGAQVNADGRVALITGITEFSGAETTATDLRAGAALVLAGLAANGKTTISNVKYIDRGYESIEDKLNALGADVKRISE
ncbi:MAG: UDP-N-acetylglucosamine 1-carboxyvinyltransferase [Lachnospirales bacterium]